MEIIPVLDIMNGMAVCGRGGDRKNYKPLKTALCNSSNPIEVARKYREEGAEKIYIADLDAIMKRGNNFPIVKRIEGYKILDGGITSKLELESLKSLNICDKVVLGTETLEDLNLLEERDIVVSLDFKDNRLSSPMNYTLEEVLERLDRSTPVIVLDISSVGSQGGINWDLLKEVMEKVENPLYVGGGVKDEEDLERCYYMGIQGILIGTAIHRGTLKLREIIEKYRD
ncbi:MAG TPA: HisA/HisF family protein [Methanothermococcus okinawensis]|uniref:HisA/HisF family protein n=1 Tax=Methanothermococcus okinawensis TaxID=155863 RepID=A0A833E3U4_9EURY|nr:HisA/HisF family protein [Methanococcaceae archaeon]HIP84499.1 HisA/HisF family protein [Methanothermococcus okinawensis]HIP91072.1 HisA/HisF family protein [Methanothermococcus okinawensis]